MKCIQIVLAYAFVVRLLFSTIECKNACCFFWNRFWVSTSIPARKVQKPRVNQRDPQRIWAGLQKLLNGDDWLWPEACKNTSFLLIHSDFERLPNQRHTSCGFSLTGFSTSQQLLTIYWITLTTFHHVSLRRKRRENFHHPALKQKWTIKRTRFWGKHHDFPNALNYDY